jgi:hypothetical protein
MRQKKTANRVLVRSLKEKAHLEDMGVDMNVVLKICLK